ncbi:MAG: cytochrome C [Deltaproteobacteria bacterium]|nr:MAG: cytochrome C [Deltaproteobacteria bacterium]
MENSTWKGIGAVLLLLLLESLGWASHPSGHSEVIFPRQVIPLRFDHGAHLEMGLDCETCHVSIGESTSVADRNLPPAETCLDCHDVEAKEPQKAVPRSDCAACHEGFDPRKAPKPEPVFLVAAHLQFSHEAHLDRGIECAACHGDFTRVGRATVAQLPRMATCLGCHDGRQAPDACGTCHLLRPDGKLRVVFPEGVLKPAGHFKGDNHFSPMWQREHGKIAGRWETYCMNCHTRSDCTECHEGNVKPASIHPNDWVTIHPRAAINRTLRCENCHTSERFCRDCHIRLRYTDDPFPTDTGGIAPLFDTEAPDGSPTRTFHGPGWVFKEGTSADGTRTVRGRNHHSNFARRNIRACAACHREETCLRCHSTATRGGLGLNPHPPGFARRGCEQLRRRNPRTCRKCHDPTGSGAESLEILCR